MYEQCFEDQRRSADSYLLNVLIVKYLKRKFLKKCYFWKIICFWTFLFVPQQLVFCQMPLFLKYEIIVINSIFVS